MNTPVTQQEIHHDLLKSIGQIRESIGQLQGAVDAFKDQRQEMTRWMAKLDDRLRTVERRAAMGGMIVSGVITTILAILGYYYQIKTSG